MFEQHKALDTGQKVPLLLGEKSPSTTAPPAIYPTILRSPEVPPSEKEFKRLENDAIFLLMAATDASSQTLAIILFHILNNLDSYQKLKAELFSAFPDITTTITMSVSEKVPYLVCSTSSQKNHLSAGQSNTSPDRNNP